MNGCTLHAVFPPRPLLTFEPRSPGLDFRPLHISLAHISALSAPQDFLFVAVISFGQNPPTGKEARWETSVRSVVNEPKRTNILPKMWASAGPSFLRRDINCGRATSRHRDEGSWRARASVSPSKWTIRRLPRLPLLSGFEMHASRLGLLAPSSRLDGPPRVLAKRNTHIHERCLLIPKQLQPGKPAVC